MNVSRRAIDIEIEFDNPFDRNNENAEPAQEQEPTEGATENVATTVETAQDPSNEVVTQSNEAMTQSNEAMTPSNETTTPSNAVWQLFNLFLICDLIFFCVTFKVSKAYIWSLFSIIYDTINVFCIDGYSDLTFGTISYQIISFKLQ